MLKEFHQELNTDYSESPWVQGRVESVYKKIFTVVISTQNNGELFEEAEPDTSELEELSQEPDEYDLSLEEDLLTDDEIDELNLIIGTDNLLKLYFLQIRNIPLLTAEEELSLGKKISENKKKPKYSVKTDPDVEMLARSNTRLVVSVAKRYYGQNLDFLDLIQEGNVGLMKAVDKYDYRKGYRFSTYAVWWIRQTVAKAIKDKSRVIRLPVHVQERLNRIFNYFRSYNQEYKRRPDLQLVADAIGLSKKTVIETLLASEQVFSLEAEMKPDSQEDERTLLDIIPDDSILSPDEQLKNILMKQKLSKALKSINPRYARMTRLRYGLEGEVPHTVKEISKLEKITEKLVRQILGKVKARLQEPDMLAVLENPDEL